MMWGYGYGSMWWMVVIQVLIATVIIAVIGFVVVVARRAQPFPGDGRTPRAILERRFARGEIDEQEYQRRASLLSHP
jgi:putative membrane protein